MAENYVMGNALDGATPAPTAPTPQINFESEQETIPLYDHDTKHVMQIPRSDVETALRTRQYALPKGVKVPIINPKTLEVRYFKDAEVYDALDAGWKLENQGDTHKRVIEERYGDSEFTALGASLLRGVSVGASDPILTKGFGVKPETLAGLDEANPIISGTGEAAGFVGSLFIPGVGPAKGAIAAGKVIEKGAAKLLAKEAAAVGASKATVQSMIAKTVPRFAGQATEATFFSTGQLLSEDALGRADFNAENFMSAVGVGALVGGGLGMAGLGIEALAPLVKKAASKIAKPVVDAAEGLSNETKAVTELFNLTKKESLRVEQNGLAPELAPYVRERLGLKKFSSDEEMLAALRLRGDAAGKTIGEIGEILDKEGSAKLLAPEASAVLERIETAVKENVLTKLEGTVAGQEALAQVNKVLRGYRNNYAGKSTMGEFNKMFGHADDMTSRLGAKDLLSEMREIDNQLQRYYRDPSTAKESIKALYEVRSVMRDEINELAERVAQVPGAGSTLGKQLKAANREFQIVKTLQPAIERKLLAKSGFSLTDTVLAGIGVSNGVTGTLMAAAGKFINSDLRRRLAILTKIEKANLDMFKAVSSATKKFFETTVPAAKAYGVYKITDSKLSYDLEGNKKPKSREEAWTNVQNNLQNFSANPDLLIERTNRQSSSMYEVAPKTSAALDMSAHNAIQFLASKMPKSGQTPGLFDFMGKKKMPSQYDVSKFERYLRAVESPKTVIKDLESGHIDQESVETLKTVYPAIYDNLRNNIINKISEKPDKIPYNKKIRLGLLLDVPTDSSMLPESILGLQSTFQQQEQQQQPPVKGAEALDISGRTSLDEQES